MNNEKEITTYHQQFKGNEWAYFLIPQIDIEKGLAHNTGVIINSNIKRAPLKTVVSYLAKNFHEKYPEAVEKLSLKPNPTKIDIATDIIKFVELSQPRGNRAAPIKTQQGKRTDEVVIEINTEDEADSDTDETSKEEKSDSEWEPESESEYDEKETSTDTDEKEFQNNTTSVQKENQIESEKEVQKENQIENKKGKRMPVERENQSKPSTQTQENNEPKENPRETNENVTKEESRINPREEKDPEETYKFEQSQQNSTLWDTWIFEPDTAINEGENPNIQKEKLQERKKSFSYWADEDDEDPLWEKALNEAYNNIQNEENQKHQTEWNKVDNIVTNQNPEETYSYDIYESCEENDTIKEIARDLLNITKEPLEEDAPEAYKEIIEMTKNYTKQLDQRINKQDSNRINEVITNGTNSPPPRSPLSETNSIPEEPTETATLARSEPTQHESNETILGESPEPTNETTKNQRNNKSHTEIDENHIENDKNSSEVSNHETSQANKRVQNQAPPNETSQPRNEQNTETVSTDNEAKSKNRNKKDRKKPHRLTHRTKEQIIKQYEKLEKEKEKIIEALKEKQNKVVELETELNKQVEGNKKQEEEIQDAIKRDESELLEQLVNKIVEKGKLSQENEEIRRKHESTKRNNQEKQSEIRKLRETLKQKDEWILELHEQKEKEISLRIKTDEVNKLLYSENESLKLLNIELTNKNEKSTKDIENLKIVVKETSKNSNQGDNEINKLLYSENESLKLINTELTKKNEKSTKDIENLKTIVKEANKSPYLGGNEIKLQEENKLLQEKLKETQTERDSWQLLLYEAQKEMAELAEAKFDWLQPKTYEKESNISIEREERDIIEQAVYCNRNNIEAQGEWRTWYRESKQAADEQYKQVRGEEMTNQNDKNYRKENCPFYLRGKCKLGNFCQLSHNNTKEITQVNNEKSTIEICRNYQRGFCRFRELCKYRHTAKENEKENREICRDHQRGRCRFKDRCKYIHKYDESTNNQHDQRNSSIMQDNSNYQKQNRNEYEFHYPTREKEYNSNNNYPNYHDNRNARKYPSEEIHKQNRGRYANQEHTQDTRCRYHENGYCRNGENCQFQHRKICYFFNKNGQCRNGENCYFIHRARKEQAHQMVNQIPSNRDRRPRY